MATDLNWSSLIGIKTLTDGGYIGDIMSVARAHIEDAVANGELTREDAGNVYSAMIPSAFQTGLKFLMEERLVEAQTDSALAEAELKGNQVDIEKNKAEAELEKQWGYTITRDTDGNLVLGDSTGAGIIDEQIETENKNQLLADKQLTDINTKNKLALLSAQLTAWSQTYNSGKLDNIVDEIDNSHIETIYDEIKATT